MFGFSKKQELDLNLIRKQFPAIHAGRILTNNAASTQMTYSILKLLNKLAPGYDNVHRGQSTASRNMTEKFEESYDKIAKFIGAKSKEEVILYRNATEAINSVMYSLLTEFNDGDNIVTTFMEHNSNYVPWYALCREILPKFGKKVEFRICNFDKETGELDLDHLREIVDNKTKIVCVTGASNFLGTRNPIDKIRKIAYSSGYKQPDGEKRSYLLIDACQMVPHCFIDVKKLDIDFLAWSFHKMLAPFGIGGLYGRKEILERIKPFLYGGDMIAEGQVSPEHVGFNKLPWKFTAGTPNILGAVLSAAAIGNLLDLVLNPGFDRYIEKDFSRSDVKKAMDSIEEYEKKLCERALYQLMKLEDEGKIKLFGPKSSAIKTPLFSFVSKKMSPFQIAEKLNEHGIESRAGCHCATLAHHYCGLNPPASCRLSFYFYNTEEEVDKAISVLRKILE